MSLRRNLNAGSGPRLRANPLGAGAPWATEEQITEVQASTLRDLAEEAGEPDAFDESISRTEAAFRINALRAKVMHERNSGFFRA